MKLTTASLFGWRSQVGRTIRRVLALGVLAAIALTATAPAAMADAAGPTDYRTDIVAIEPQTSAIRVEMIGGDAFLRLEQLEPVEIVVLGYQGEPYLRFAPDGIVFENRRSPAVWLNEERYGTDDQLPTFADPDARPEWLQIADGGRYAWHDHRSHWMNPQRPPGAEPGDQVLESTVPIDIDNERVTITVASYLLDEPSAVPALVGVTLGLVAAGAGWRAGRSSRALMALFAATTAALLGAIAFRSVPTETGPSPMLWLLPAIAIGALAVLLLIRNRTATTVYLDGLAVAAGATLAAWGIVRFDALRRALIPSDAPAWTDRLVIALGIVVGAALALRGIYGLLRPQRLPAAVVPA